MEEIMALPLWENLEIFSQKWILDIFPLTSSSVEVNLNVNDEISCKFYSWYLFFPITKHFPDLFSNLCINTIGTSMKYYKFWASFKHNTQSLSFTVTHRPKFISHELSNDVTFMEKYKI